MMNAPSNVNEKQLNELNISLKAKKWLFFTFKTNFNIW
jgi:hypothetical protein